MLISLPNIIGLLGVAVILIWYFLLQVGKSKSTDFTYSLMNAIGALLIFYSLLYEWNLPTAVIEVIWFLISAYGMVNSVRLKVLRDKNKI